MFVAPSQVKRVCEGFEGIGVQLVITRSGHRDILTARLDNRGVDRDRLALQLQFEKVFQEICTVKVDAVEFLEPRSLKDDAKLLVDERTWN